MYPFARAASICPLESSSSTCTFWLKGSPRQVQSRRHLLPCPHDLARLAVRQPSLQWQSWRSRPPHLPVGLRPT